MCGLCFPPFASRGSSNRRRYIPPPQKKQGEDISPPTTGQDTEAHSFLSRLFFHTSEMALRMKQGTASSSRLPTFLCKESKQWLVLGAKGPGLSQAPNGATDSPHNCWVLINWGGIQTTKFELKSAPPVSLPS